MPKRKTKTKKKILKEFQEIPGIGVKMSEKLYTNLGYRSLEEMKDEDPEDMYRKCAVYYCSTKEEDREVSKLKWWNWKD